MPQKCRFLFRRVVLYVQYARAARPSDRRCIADDGGTFGFVRGVEEWTSYVSIFLDRRIPSRRFAFRHRHGHERQSTEPGPNRPRRSSDPGDDGRRLQWPVPATNRSPRTLTAHGWEHRAVPKSLRVVRAGVRCELFLLITLLFTIRLCLLEPCPPCL